MSESNDVSLLDSPPPQLIDTSVAPRLFAATTAPNRLLLLLEAASTRTILAPGASAWAHSMSSDSSSTHPALTFGVPCGSACSKHGPLWDSDVQADSCAYPYWAFVICQEHGTRVLPRPRDHLAAAGSSWGGCCGSSNCG